MKGFNFIYIVAIVAGIVIWQLNKQFSQEAVVFYGFAENKETEINLEHPVLVNKIYVSDGEFVKANTPLMEVAHNKLPLKLNDIEFETQEIKAKQQLWKVDIQVTIDKLQSKKAIKTSEIQSEIARINAKIEQNKALVKDLNTIDETELAASQKITQAKITALENELAVSLAPLDNEIQRLERKLKEGSSPYSIQINKLQTERLFYEDKGRKLYITAPTDGLIGNIHCKEAENISSFKTLVTFYEENPTSVKGYVHEKMVIHVAIGDTLTVVSTLQSDYECKGVVIGLGSRIVEIPTRLRKFEEIKNYGREVMIQIPAENNFLQKEKVILRTEKSVKTKNGLFVNANNSSRKSSSNITEQLKYD